MKKNNIPDKLHHLIHLVEKWGINDDGYRDELIENASTEDLQNIVDSIDEQTLSNLNNWLSDNNEILKLSAEYINYTCFYMAYEYAERVLEDRN